MVKGQVFLKLCAVMQIICNVCVFDGADLCECISSWVQIKVSHVSTSENHPE